jgi:hypothetical protein
MAPLHDTSVYRGAGRLIQRHGDETLRAIERHIGQMADQRNRNRVYLWLRIRQAVLALQAKPTGLLH